MLYLLDSFFEKLLDLIPLHPNYYSFLFPQVVSIQEIVGLFEQGFLPNLSKLAPAFTYALLLSIARFILQNYVVKVQPQFPDCLLPIANLDFSSL
jgi:hypothetical protein